MVYAYPWFSWMEVDALDSLAPGEELSLQVESDFSSHTVICLL
jgi:hypothetical protein